MSCYTTTVQEAYHHPQYMMVQPQHMMAQYGQPQHMMVEHYCRENYRENYRENFLAGLLQRVTPCVVNKLLGPKLLPALKTGVFAKGVDPAIPVAKYLQKLGGSKSVPTAQSLNNFIFAGELVGAGTALHAGVKDLLPYVTDVYNKVQAISSNPPSTDPTWNNCTFMS